MTESKNQKPNFNFHCYSFNSLFGLDEIRTFIQESYHKRIPNPELPRNIYENAARTLNDIVHRNYYLRNQMSWSNDQPPREDQCESFECDEEPQSEDAAEITNMVYEVLENEFNSSEMGTFEKENVLERLKNRYGHAYLPGKDVLKNNLRGFKAQGISPERFKRATLSMHLASAFWSVPFCELSFQSN